MKAHFQKLYGESSFTAMDAILEEQCIPYAPEGSKELELFKKMYESNDLDERQLMCAEYLGYNDHAQQLREWLKKKSARRFNQNEDFA